MSTAELDRTIAALADPTRRAVVGMLRHGPARSGELAEQLGMSHPATSRHLRVLREASLVVETPDSEDRRARLYALQAPRFDALRGWLDDVAAFWEGQLDAFAQHVKTRQSSKSS